MVKLSIVILNYNRLGVTKECLNSIHDQANSSLNRKLELELIVVDNNSSDGSREYLKKLSQRHSEVNTSAEESPEGILRFTQDDAKIKLIFNDQNLGFTGGNNVGIKYALENGADYIMLLNNDVLIKNDFWKSMVNYLQKNNRVGVLGPKIYFASGHEFHKERYTEQERGKVIWYAGGEIDWDNVYTTHRGVDEVDKGQYEKVSETDFVSGCCLLAKRQVWQKAGLLDNKYFLYYEDSDFCQRVKKMGWEVVYYPKASIWHINAGSSRVGGELQDYFNSRNRMLFGMRWAPLRSKTALIRESIKLLADGRKWQKIGIRDFYLRKFGKGSWQC